MEIHGISVSGKICSGKETFLKLMKKLAGPRVTGLAFADKLKLYAKYFLVLLANEPAIAVRKISVLMRQQLFDNKISLEFVEQKMQWLANQSHTKEFVKPGLKVLNNTSDFPEKDFGFDNIDALLWTDCAKPRKMLQELGTECMRSLDDSVWVRYAFSIAKKHQDAFFVLTDSRFPNELAFARKNHFLDIRLEASEKIRMQRGMDRDGQDYSMMQNHASETSLDDYPFTVVLQNEGSPDELETQIWANPILENLIIRLRKESAEKAFQAIL